MKTAEELSESQRSPLTASAVGLADDSIKSLVERLMLWMPGLSDVEARYAIMDCAREFCSKTNCWTVEPKIPFGNWVGPVAWTVAKPDIPSGATALRVREMRCGTWTWRGLPPFVIVEHLPGPEPKFTFGAIPREICALRLRAAALGGDAPFFCVRLALAPAIGGEDLPAELVERWGEAFVTGARANLAALTGKAWSDPNAAAMCGARYNSFVNEARTSSEIAGVPSHLQTRSKIPFVI